MNQCCLGHVNLYQISSHPLVTEGVPFLMSINSKQPETLGQYYTKILAFQR